MPLLFVLDRLKAELDALRPLAPEQEQPVMQELRLEWTYHANAAAGNLLTLPETRSLLLHGLTAAGKPLRDHLAVQAHNEAVLWLMDFARDEHPLTEQHLRALHKVLLGRADGGLAHARKAGQYKTSPNNALSPTGELVYFSSPEDTRARVVGLLGWYRDEAAFPTLHPVELAAKLYHRFAHIRPFEDGNGRLARLLLNLVLLRHGYGIAVLKAADQPRYLAALAAADTGEPEPFLRYLIENVEASLRRQIRAAKGESIDEPVELEVKLAQLKEQLQRREDNVRALWGAEIQAQIYEALVSGWLADLNQQTLSFDDFFMTHGYAGSVASGPPQPVLLEEEGDVKTFSATLQAAISSARPEVAAVGFSKKWYHFRQRNNGFDVGVRVTMHFRLDHFTVSHAVLCNYGGAGPETYWQDEVYDSCYLPVYDQPRMQELNYQLANKLYEYITAKIAESDAPA